MVVGEIGDIQTGARQGSGNRARGISEAILLLDQQFVAGGKRGFDIADKNVGVYEDIADINEGVIVIVAVVVLAPGAAEQIAPGRRSRLGAT